MLENKKVQVVACGTSMLVRNIEKDKLADGFIYVPASLKEIIKRKQEGYISYFIKINLFYILIIISEIIFYINIII